MSVNNNHQFLLSVISNAEDLELMASKFNLGHSDSVLRGGVEFDDRILIIYGTKKRNEMCQKKLPKMLDSMDKTYDPSRFVYLTDANLKEFVDKEISAIRNGTSTVLITHDEQPKPAEQLKLSKQVPATEDVTTETEELTTQDDVEQDEVEAKSEEVSTDISRTSDNTSGLCRYNVPKLRVEYQQPNVLGLQESLFVNVEEETMASFFNSVKGRVLANARQGI